MRRTLAFPSLKKPGVFVVELIGNGKSSRALLRKGRLRFVERTSAAGHVFRVLDEDNRALPDATLWLAGREYLPEKDGTITVPSDSAVPATHFNRSDTARFDQPLQPGPKE